MAKLSDIFDIESGNDLELCYLKKDNDGINFISRTSKNNGISAKVSRLSSDTKPNKAGTITVAVGGSVLETFLQSEDYYTGYHIKILTPKEPMSDAIKLYYCLCVKLNKYRYNFGRQANATLGLLEVPSLDEIPKWVDEIKIKDISYYKKTLLTTTTPKIDLKLWKPFKVSDLFDTIEQCKCGNAGNLMDGDEIWYIGAKKNENGLMKQVVKENNLVSKGNCIIMIGDGQGSVGYANYMDKDFIGSTTLYAGYINELDKYVGLFLTGIFNVNRFRYNYGRKWNGDRLKNSEIMLPVVLDDKGHPILTDGLKYTPDYEFMRSYIKTLPYSKSI